MSQPHDVRRAYEGTRVLVLGASGFIGRWVARALSEAGADVVVSVRSRATAVPVLDRWGIDAPMLEADLRDDQAVLDVCRAVEPSITFNLTGYGVDAAERDDEPAYAINARLVGRLAEVLAKQQDPRWAGCHLVHVGSALEYGDVSGLITEETRPKPTTLYGRSKLLGTELLETVCRNSSLRAVTARLFMVYGLGEHDHRLLPQLLRVADEGTDLHVTSGRQARDFTYVEDVAEGLLRLGMLPGLSGTTVNLGTGRLRPVRDVIEITAAQLAIPSERIHFGSLPTRPEEMTGLTGISNARLLDLTGWTPPTSLEDGVAQLLRRRRDLSIDLAPALDSPPRRDTVTARRDPARRTRTAPRRPRPDVSIVMPCYNEASIVEYTVRRLVSAFGERDWQLELVTVDNGSTDATGDILARLEAQLPGVVRHRVDRNQGYGYGILAGLPLCKADWIGTIPADGQVDAEDVVRLFEAAVASDGWVVAKVRRRFRMDGLWRKVVSILYNLFVLALWPRLGSIDVNGSPKLFPRRAYEAMDLQSTDWLLDPEIMIKAHRLGLNVLELNVFARMRGNGLSHVRVATCWQFLHRLVEFRCSGVFAAWEKRARQASAQLEAGAVAPADEKVKSQVV